MAILREAIKPEHKLVFVVQRDTYPGLILASTTETDVLIFKSLCNRYLREEDGYIEQSPVNLSVVDQDVYLVTSEFFFRVLPAFSFGTEDLDHRLSQLSRESLTVTAIMLR